MPNAAVDVAIRAKLTSSWTICPVIDADGVTEPPNVNAFLVVQYPVITASKPVLNGRYFEDGVARLVLNVKATVGPTTGSAWADTLAGLFREYRPGGGFETFVPSPAIINDANDDGNWFEFAITVPYRYQHNS